MHPPLSMRRSCGWYTVASADTVSDNRGKPLRPPTRCWPSSSFTAGREAKGEGTSLQVAKLVVMMYVNCEMRRFLRQLSEVSSSSKSS